MRTTAQVIDVVAGFQTRQVARIQFIHLAEGLNRSRGAHWDYLSRYGGGHQKENIDMKTQNTKIAFEDLSDEEQVQGLEGLRGLRSDELLSVAGGMPMSDPSGYLSSATNGGDSDPIRV
jgi:hypothetical protein